jgi:hypothetical protein
MNIDRNLFEDGPYPVGRPFGDDPVTRRDFGTHHQAGALLRDEGQYRAKQGKLGVGDLVLSGMASYALTFAEVFQNDAEADPSFRSLSLMDALGHAPLDWKAAGVSVGAFVAISATDRIRRHLRFNRDAKDEMRHLATAEQFRPATRTETNRRRRRERCGRGILTAAGCFVTYKAGEHGTVGQDAIAQGALITGSLVGLGIAKWRSRTA